MKPIKTPRTLLHSYLTAEQLACLKKYDHFFVVTPSRHVYCLVDGQRVFEMYAGQPYVVHNAWAVDRILGHPLHRDASRLLQLLLLSSEGGEDKLLRTACHNHAEGYFTELALGCPPMKRAKAVDG
jgi:hypothetical protein